MKVYKIYSTEFLSDNYLQIIVAKNKDEAIEIAKENFLYSNEKIHIIEEITTSQKIYNTCGRY
jgi:hypothetical protein